MRQRSHGTGAIISRKGTRNLYIRYWQDGRQIQEAVGSDSREDAERMLRERMVDGDRGAVPMQDIKQLRYEDLRASYLKMNPEQENYPGLQHLDSFFKDKRIDRINADMIENFIEHRRDDDEVSDPTISPQVYMREEDIPVTFQIALVGSDGLVIGSDRNTVYISPETDGSSSIQRLETNKFSKNTNETVFCVNAGGLAGATIAKEIISSVDLVLSTVRQ